MSFFSGKNILFLLICLILGLPVQSMGQSPGKMSYQTVIRDASGDLVMNSPVGIQLSILQGTANGTVVYKETHQSVTNDNGLATLQIGTGSVLTGVFDSIDWAANGPFYLKTETDPSGGSNYSIQNTSQFLSVPYALHAKTADVPGVPGPEGPQGPPGPTCTVSSVTYNNDGSITITDCDSNITTIGGSWLVKGNVGLSAASNFLGTIDTVDLVFRTNNTERARIESGGRSTFNYTPSAGFEILGAAASGTNDALFGFIDAAGTGVGVYGNSNSSTTGAAGYFYNQSSTNTAAALTGYHVGNGHGVNGRNDGTSTFAVRGYNNNSAGTGVFGAGNGTEGTYLTSGTGGAFTGDAGVFGLANVAAGTGVIGTGNNQSANTNTLVSGSGVAGTGSETGLYGYYVNTTGQRQGAIFTGDDATAPYSYIAGYSNSNSAFAGGYFDGGQTLGDYAYVGFNFGGTDYKILGGVAATVSTQVPDTKGENRIMFASEAPEFLFEDYGTGQLNNGEAYIKIDPILAKNIHVSKEYPIKVFIQLEGDCKGVYVTDKTKNGFRVVELQGGTSNISFSWHVVANVKDFPDNKHVGVRFPKGPKRTKKEATKNMQSKQRKVDKNKPGEIRNLRINK